MIKSDNRWIWITIGSIIVIFAAFSVLFWQIGLFNFTGTDASAKIVAASIALIGGFIGSLVTVIGVLLKHSIDQRAEKRLKLEAAIQAVQLLSTSSGGEVPITQRAGVLFTLASLGLLDLALKMLRQMISIDRIDPNTASWLIDHAFESGNLPLQDEAVQIIYDYPEKFLMDRGRCAFPRNIDLIWNTKLPEIVRTQAAIARLKLIAIRPYSDWYRDYLNGHVGSLNSIWETEPDHIIRNGVGLCLEKIIRKYPVGSKILAPAGVIHIDDLRKKLTELVEDPNLETSDTFRQLSWTLEQWSKTKLIVSKIP